MSKDKQNELELLGEKILPGKSVQINFKTSRLYTRTSVEIPVIVERAKKPGPVVLITAGIHGDEINGVEIVRHLISKGINKPKKGTIICIPLLNVFGFLNREREFPGGRDLNRVFPGFKKGSLASRFAYQFVHEILPIADFCMDFHTGGGSRFNAAQIRIKKSDTQLLEYARIFNMPFTVFSAPIKKSYREICSKSNKPILLFEGGKSGEGDEEIVSHGVEGAMRILAHLEMLGNKFELPENNTETILIEKAKWLRAKYSGLLHVSANIGEFVKKGDYIATITDPYGKFRHRMRVDNDGYLININQSPIVYEGDAIFNISHD